MSANNNNNDIADEKEKPNNLLKSWYCYDSN